MSLGFSLMQDSTVWKITTTVLGSWVKSKYVEATQSSIDTALAEWYPYKAGDTTLALPTGVKSTSAIIVTTVEDWSIATDLKGKVADAQRIYIVDPASDANAPVYRVEDKAFWKSNGAFTLLGDHYEYLLVREEKK